MYLGRVRVVRRSIAAALRHVLNSRYAACARGRKPWRGPPVALPGVDVWRRAWGDRAQYSFAARHAALNDQIFASMCSYKLNTEDATQPVSHSVSQIM